MPLVDKKSNTHPLYKLLMAAVGFINPQDESGPATYSHVRVEIAMSSTQRVATVVGADGQRLFLASVPLEEKDAIEPMALYLDREAIFGLPSNLSMDDLKKAGKTDVPAYRVDAVLSQIHRLAEPYSQGFKIRRNLLSDASAYFSGIAHRACTDSPALVSLAWDSDQLVLSLFIDGRERASKYFPIRRTSKPGSFVLDADTLVLIVRSLLGDDVDVQADTDPKRPVLFRDDSRLILALPIPPRP